MMTAKYLPQAVFTGPFHDLVNEFLGRPIGHDDVRRSIPSVNIVEREKDFHLRLLAPGHGKEDLKLNVENEVLTISAERKKEELKENERWTRREFSHSAFTRSFRLPEHVDADGISAEFVDGVLHVSIPKTGTAKPRSREISIG